MQLYGLNCVCWEKNWLNFVDSGKIWAEICEIKYVMYYEIKKNIIWDDLLSARNLYGF